MKRCCVCDSPVRGERCTVCGMPYRDEEEMYHLNENRRDHYKHASGNVQKKLQALEQPRRENKTIASADNTDVRKKAKKKSNDKELVRKIGINRSIDKKKKKWKGIFWGIIILVILIEVVPVGIQKIREIYYESVYWKLQDVNPTEPEEMVDPVPDGYYEIRSFDQVLSSGEYIIGQEIPAGIYYISREKDGEEEVTLNLNDSVNGFYEFFVFSDEEPEDKYEEEYLVKEKEEVPLLEGGVLEFQGNVGLHFVCEEAYYSENWNKQENPVQTEYTLPVGETEIGKDMDAGVYDLKLMNGEGYINIERPDRDPLSISLSRDSVYGIHEFLHMELPEGSRVLLESYGDVGNTCKVVLKTSPRIYEKE